jgi:CO/xanthine dehydrogenase Mo-binding subunit
MLSNTLPKSLADNPRLDRWIVFEAGGKVRVATGKVELGQGILTALSQIAADELDVTPEHLQMLSGDTGASPSEGFTSGSNSVLQSGGAIRLVCAEIRALFLAAAAAKVGCDAADLAVEEGRFLLHGAPTGHDYWSLAGEVSLARDATGSTPTKRPSEYRYVGKSLPRLDLPDKLAGRGFIHDISPADVLHARMIHRRRIGAHLQPLDEAPIRKAAGAPVTIGRDGDLAWITGDDETAVMRAAAAARQQAIWTGGHAIPENSDSIECLRSQPSRDRVIEEGDRPQGKAATTIEGVYSRPYLVHGPIGPSLALASFRDGQLTVETHSQGVYVLRHWLARTLGLEEASVTVLHRQGAGCYGHNSADDAAFDAAFLALRNPDRTVRVQWLREDEFSAAPVGSAMAVRIEAKLGADGRPIDWTMDIWSPIHGRRPGMNSGGNLLGADALPGAVQQTGELHDVPDAIGGGATRNAIADYDLPHQRIVHHLLPDTPLRTTTIRGLGAQANVFAIESMIDEIAERVGEDPVAYRLSLLSDPRSRAVVEAAAAMSDWEMARNGDGRVLGFGFGRYKNRSAYMAAVAEVEVEEEVRVKRIWAAVDAGLVINPDGAINQVEGGIIQAASWTLKERLRFEGGEVVSDTWETYPILRFSEVPEIEVRLMERSTEPAVGLGEAAVGPTTAAIANAVASALGVRLRELPLSRERIMETLLAG